MSKLTDFIDFMDKAIEENKGIKVVIEMPDLLQPELIINPACNVIAKRDYYSRAYNDDLELKTFNAIKISDYETF